MRPLKVLAAALALSLLAAPALAEARPNKPPAAAKAKAKAAKKGAAKGDEASAQKRDERIQKALEKQGVDSARAKQVVGVMNKYRAERKPVHEEMKKQREALRALLDSNSTDEAAYTRAIDGIEAGRKKLAGIQEKQVSEIRGILKPSEQAKVLRLMHNAKKRGGPDKSAKHQGAKKHSRGA